MKEITYQEHLANEPHTSYEITFVEIQDGLLKGCRKNQQTKVSSLLIGKKFGDVIEFIEFTRPNLELHAYYGYCNSQSKQIMGFWKKASSTDYRNLFEYVQIIPEIVYRPKELELYGDSRMNPILKYNCTDCLGVKMIQLENQLSDTDAHIYQKIMTNHRD